MGPSIIARNYAETLLALAQRQGGDAEVDAYGRAIEQVAGLLRDEPTVREFLETPRVDAAAKKKAIRTSFEGRVPEPFLRFLLVVVEKRRQTLLDAIAREYHDLVDEQRGRIRAEVVLAAEPDAELKREVETSLERRFGKAVIATYRVDPSLIGGVVIRAEDQIIDGSFRRRVSNLRRRLLETRMPAARA